MREISLEDIMYNIMNATSRIIVNIIAQYTNTFINVCLSLYSTRLILSALGVEDYGIYTLVAGVVSLLSFAVNALVATTQRYMSYSAGKGNIEIQKDIFNNSLIIHLFLGIVIALCIEFIGQFMFNGGMSISENRVYAAKIVYHCVTIMLTLSFFTAPFKAILISHENIVYTSLIGIIDGILKVFIAILIAKSSNDRLILYSYLLLCISFFNFIALAGYSYYKYEECILPRISKFSPKFIKDISSFAGWTIYSVGCTLGRVQGIAIVINHFFGVVVNAAYGIALQVNSAVMFLSHSVINAMNPQLMKAEGSGDREKMLELAEAESKISFILLATVVIPCIFEMPRILFLWLGEVPQYSVFICRCFLAISLIDQLTYGLNSANQAIGNIKEYSLLINSIKLIVVPISLACVYLWNKVEVVMLCFIISEIIGSILRLPFLKTTAGLSIEKFVKNVFNKELIPICVLIMGCVCTTHLSNSENRIFITFSLPIVLYIIAVILLALNQEERQILIKYIKR